MGVMGASCWHNCPTVLLPLFVSTTDHCDGNMEVERVTSQARHMKCPLASLARASATASALGLAQDSRCLPAPSTPTRRASPTYVDHSRATSSRGADASYTVEGDQVHSGQDLVQESLHVI